MPVKEKFELADKIGGGLAALNVILAIVVLVVPAWWTASGTGFTVGIGLGFAETCIGAKCTAWTSAEWSALDGSKGLDVRAPSPALFTFSPPRSRSPSLTLANAVDRVPPAPCMHATVQPVPSLPLFLIPSICHRPRRIPSLEVSSLASSRP
jgi:hypothetical protein